MLGSELVVVPDNAHGEPEEERLALRQGYIESSPLS